MIDYDAPVSERIEALHAEAEELATQARFADPVEAARLRLGAQYKVRQAARLRSRYEKEDA